MDKPVFDTKKAQSILDGIRESVDKLAVADIQLVAAPQLDRLDSLRCSLVFTIDATQAVSELSGQLSYGGKRYKKPL
jgi:hypothetical protein